MSFLSQTNKPIRRRGYEYYCSGKVTSKTKIDDEIAKGKVNGYDVTINLDKPRNSKCTCKYKKDNPYKICKHMVALFLSLYPSEAKKCEEMIAYEDAIKEEDDGRKLREINVFIKNSPRRVLEDIVRDTLMEKDGWIVHQYFEDYY